ncbi:MaoC/PaaZ C-terminal domain-containing protein [Nevskia ramosa]|uniref:MaoC/PaaZ C-terminal domain-containing protein n=1 Tax=Nevskia ramosa TaxID=64002 RepID=UPI0003B4768F|nr:MaoC/PaaZ C-terminal domain-containing protein [Nevskia ramosa]
MNDASTVLAEYETGPITREMLAAYAEASGDTNPLHLDPAFAQKAGFADVIVHGMLSMALLGRLLCSRFANRELLKFDARFAAILPVNTSLRCRARLADVVEGQPDDGHLRLALEAIDPAGTVIITGSAELAAAN